MLRAQQVKNHLIEIKLEQIANHDYRYCLLSAIAKDGSFGYIIDEDNNSVLLTSVDEWSDEQLQVYFDEFKAENERVFSDYMAAEKESRGASFVAWKESLPRDLFVLLFRLNMIENPNNRTGNQTCATAEPFCTTDVVTFHVNASASGTCENGPDYGCMSPYTDRPPFWYYMKIGVAGTFTIRITNSNDLDLDFCAWGPFSDESTPCTSQLTSNKIIDCDSPYNSVQECTIPSSSQVGNYFLMVITKYSSGSTDITFQKKANSGPGETDCGILPGYASNDGPYCVGQTINLSVNAQEGASYSWTGPGGFTSSQRTPSRPNCTMAMAGTYTCVTTVGTQSVTATTTVVIYPQPTANFTATTVCQGNATQFTSTSTTNPSGQSISSYQWSFGDGGTSTQQNPTHTYAQPGTYTVTLTVNCGGNCSDTKTQTVTVLAQPTCNFTFTTVCSGSATQFTSTASGEGITSYQWNFGDGQTGNGATASHTYAQPGTYTVTHTVATGNGDCSDTMTQTVTVLPQPISNFIFTATCAGSPTDFFSTSTGDVTSFQWDFGDGQTGSGEDVTHIYAQPGTYQVTLVVAIANNACTDALTQSVTILPQPVCDFNFTTVCAGTPTDFTSTSTGNDISIYHWTFGDGQTGSGQNVTHTYAQAGTYEVTHTVSSSDGYCEDAVTQTVTVNAMPVANAGPDQTISYYTTAQLSGSAGTGTFSFHWEPANKVTNPNAQNTQTTQLDETTTFTLTVTNPQSQECVDTDQVTIHINGGSMTVTPGPNVSICQGGSATIQVNAGGGTGSFNYSWTPTTGLSNPSIYNPVASPTQTTTYTCHVDDGSTSQNVSVTVTVNDIIIEHENVSVCPGESYTWDWDGNSYSSPGTYEYNTTTPEGCEETIYLHLDQYPEYEGIMVNGAICYGDSYPFNGVSYNQSGQYPHTLQTVHGCDSIVTLNLTVYDDHVTVPTHHLQPLCVSQIPWVYPYDPNQTPLYEGSYTFTLQDQHGCDSIVILELEVSDYYEAPTDHVYRCYQKGETPSYTWETNGQTYHESTTVQETLPYGDCEGIFSLDLRFLEIPEAKHIDTTVCNSFPWYVEGQLIGIYSDNAEEVYSIPLDPYPCTKDYYLHLVVNHESVSNEIHITEPVCDEYIWQFGWNGETYSFTENGSWTKTIQTADGCDSIATLHISNMTYTPNPEIRCQDGNVEYPHFPITATEFNVNRYTFYAIDPRSDATWVNDQCQWSISKPSWRIEPSADNRSCTVYAMDWTADTIWLTFKAANPCSDPETDSASFWFKPSFYGIEEQEAYPASVSVVPNPNNGQMQLRFENMEGRLNIKVYSTGGALLDSFEVNTLQMGETYDYSMRRLQNGVYHIVVSDGKRSVTKKVVVIH